MSEELSCDHKKLDVQIELASVSLVEGDYSNVQILKLRVVCSCGARFGFSGLPVSEETLSPRVSADGLEAYLPIATGLPPPEVVTRWIPLGGGSS